ncbi:MAG: hypothetical protein IKJ63_10005 [Clostridia bacterium]|nr:hypothetical protein [Clostridia bacterium]
MAKSKKSEQAIFYQNFKGAIYGGTPEQVKNLMIAFFQYAFDGIDHPTVAPDIAMTFGMMKASVNADRKHYQEACKQNRINALKKTGLTISGYVHQVLDAGEYITFTVDDEEYRFVLANANEATKQTLKDTYPADFVEIEIKGGRPISIRQVTERNKKAAVTTDRYRSYIGLH